MVISRVIIRVTPFRALITLSITYLPSPLPLQVYCLGTWTLRVLDKGSPKYVFAYLLGSGFSVPGLLHGSTTERYEGYRIVGFEVEPFSMNQARVEGTLKPVLKIQCHGVPEFRILGLELRVLKTWLYYSV